MGGVDRMDQNVSCYRILMRSQKWWWRPLAAYLFDVSVQNAWILYRLSAAYKDEPLDQLNFRRSICSLYFRRYQLERPEVQRTLGRPMHLSKRVPEPVCLDRRDHYISSSGTQCRCAVCGRKVRKECKKCNVGLHIECFSLFHT